MRVLRGSISPIDDHYPLPLVSRSAEDFVKAVGDVAVAVDAEPILALQVGEPTAAVDEQGQGGGIALDAEVMGPVVVPSDGQ